MLAMQLAVAYAAITLLASGQEGGQAHDTKYASLTILNHSGAVMKYQFRWGQDGKWKEVELAPRETMTHNWTFDVPNENKAPTPMIRLYRPDGTTVRQMGLEWRASPDGSIEKGTQYRFKGHDKKGDPLPWVKK